jgi:hypothetical protein
MVSCAGRVTGPQIGALLRHRILSIDPIVHIVDAEFPEAHQRQQLIVDARGNGGEIVEPHCLHGDL